MQANQNQKLSIKDRIVSHLPGHKHQDKNMNGVPDRLEKSTPSTSAPLQPALATTAGGVGPMSSTTTTTTYSSDLNRNGVPDALEQPQFPSMARSSDLNGNGIPDSLERSGSDLNRNGIPDQLERQGSFGQPSFAQGTDLNRNGIPDQLERPGLQQTGFTDFNRNGIPDQLEGQQGFGFVGSVPAVQTSVVDIREAPAVVERVEKPAVVHEVYKTEEVVQIQPVIEREREQLDVYEVVQPMREREVIATEVREAVLPAQTRAAIVEDNSAFLAARSAPSDFSTREVAATRSQVIENAPIVHETVVHKVIEEVQPVIYKEIDRPVLVKETLPIYEKIVEAPHAHHTVLPMRDLGVRTVTTGFTDLNRDGIPDQLQGGMYQTTGLQSGLQSQGFVGQSGLSGLQSQGLYNSGLSSDLNGNGIPDSLEGHQHPRTLSDLNGNGVPDRMEKAHGLRDLNGNGVDDSLERRMGSASLNANTRV